MFRLPVAALPLACLLVSACSWVALEPAANEVLVLPANRLPADCESRGLVTVSVVEKVGVLKRHDNEVIEDLDILARNHAAEQNADTVVARGPVEDGARRYEVFRCTEAGEGKAERREAEPAKVEVVPYVE